MLEVLYIHQVFAYCMQMMRIPSRSYSCVYWLVRLLLPESEFSAGLFEICMFMLRDFCFLQATINFQNFKSLLTIHFFVLAFGNNGTLCLVLSCQQVNNTFQISKISLLLLKKISKYSTPIVTQKTFSTLSSLVF